MSSRRAQCSGRLAGFSTPVANEARLQEMYALAQRKQGIVAGPGSYEVTKLSSVVKCSHRRPSQIQLDGPFPLQPGLTSLRCQQINQLLLLKDSGVSPAAYKGLACKDACMARAPTPKIGTARRAGSGPVSPGKLCLSLSRCMTSGLNWSRPMPVGQLQPHMMAASSPHEQPSITYTSTGPVAGSCTTGTLQQHACTASEQYSCTTASTQQHQLLQLGGTTRQAPPKASTGCSPSSDDSSTRMQASCPAAQLDTAARSGLPWHVARQLADWDNIVQALKQAAVSQHPLDSGQLQLSNTQQQPPLRASIKTVLGQQQVMQHFSAARAAEAVAQLAARRARWQQLSRDPHLPQKKGMA